MAHTPERSVENSAQNTGPKRDERGRLRGGNPGNSGGKKGRSGRPPSVIREMCRGAFAQRIKILKKIADGEAIERVKLANGEEMETMKSADVSDRLKAIDLLGKYGLGTKQEVTGADDEPLVPQGLTPDQMAATVAQLLATAQARKDAQA